MAVKPPPAPKNATTVTILGCGPGFDEIGQPGLVIETKEAGTIAFLVPLLAIPSLRKALDDIEQILTRPKAKRH
jgi:hypothetical protein